MRPAGFWPGFVLGVPYFSYIFWWFWSVYPLVSKGTDNNLSFLIILLPFVVTVTGMSFFWGIFGYFAHDIQRKTRRAFLPLFCAGIFVLVEYIRTWFFGILWAGQGSLLGAHWTLGNPAYLFADIGPVRQSASYWGIYGIDFFIVFVGSALFMLARPRNWGSKKIPSLEILSAVAILVFLNLSTSLDKPRPENTELNVSIIQTAKPVRPRESPEELLADFSEKNKLLKEASKVSDVVIFPESADFSKTLSGFLDTASAQKYFTGLSPKNLLIIDSDRIPEPGGVRSKVVFIDSRDGVVGSYDKKLLTPGGEFLPYLAALPLWVFERAFQNNFISSEAGFVKGTGDNVLDHNGHKLKIAVCSDIVSPGISGGDEFDFMVNIGSLAVFNGSRMMERELISIARFRATENGKYLVTASNFGRSYIINNKGEIEKSTDSPGYQILTTGIVPNNESTWYNKLGDLPILLLSLAIFGLFLKKFHYV